jgi:hypothetical protein
MNSKLAQNQTRNVLYALLSIPICINLYLAFHGYNFSNDRVVFYGIEFAIVLIVLIIAKVKNILNFKSLVFTSLIALLLLIFSLFR